MTRMDHQEGRVTQSTDYDAIVVGGGASGVVAAARLAAAGRQVLLLEAGTRFGGCIQSWSPSADFWLELGAHTAYNSYGPLLRALTDSGGADALLRREKLGYRFLRADGGVESPMARLSVLEAAVSLPFGLRRAKTGRDVADWFGRLLGVGNYRRLLAPAFAAVLSQPADRFPAEWLFRRKPRVKSAPRKYTYPGGLQALLETIVRGAGFEAHLQMAVTRLERQSGGFRVEAGAQVWRCAQLLLAVPADAAARLLRPAWPELASRLEQFPVVEVPAIGVVVEGTRTRLPQVAGLIGADDLFWSVVTRDPVPHPNLRGFTFHFRPDAGDEAACRARIAAVLGVAESDFLHVHATINRLPALDMRHPPMAAEISAMLDHQPLALLGNYLNGLSIGDCAERAEREVDRLLST